MNNSPNMKRMFNSNEGPFSVPGLLMVNFSNILLNLIAQPFGRAHGVLIVRAWCGSFAHFYVGPSIKRPIQKTLVLPGWNWLYPLCYGRVGHSRLKYQ